MAANDFLAVAVAAAPLEADARKVEIIADLCLGYLCRVSAESAWPVLL